jgi:hypothetical protein
MENTDPVALNNNDSSSNNGRGNRHGNNKLRRNAANNVGLDDIIIQEISDIFEEHYGKALNLVKTKPAYSNDKSELVGIYTSPLDDVAKYDALADKLQKITAANASAPAPAPAAPAPAAANNGSARRNLRREQNDAYEYGFKINAAKEKIRTKLASEYPAIQKAYEDAQRNYTSANANNKVVAESKLTQADQRILRMGRDAAPADLNRVKAAANNIRKTKTERLNTTRRASNAAKSRLNNYTRARNSLNSQNKPGDYYEGLYAEMK